MGKKKSVPSGFIRVIRVIRGYSSSMKHEELTGDVTGLELARLLNFKEAKLARKRVVSGNRGDD
jgi:hypothetical protein